MPEKKRKEGTAEKTTKPEKAAKTAKPNESTVFIGRKPVMNYVVACLTYFSTGGNKVVVKARGQAISRAVDTVEVLRRGFVKDLQVQGISVCTEEVTRSEGQKSNVSAIEISLVKP